jgi:hypothetical protein
VPWCAADFAADYTHLTFRVHPKQPLFSRRVAKVEKFTLAYQAVEMAACFAFSKDNSARVCGDFVAYTLWVFAFYKKNIALPIHVFCLSLYDF